MQKSLHLLYSFIHPYPPPPRLNSAFFTSLTLSLHGKALIRVCESGLSFSFTLALAQLRLLVRKQHWHSHPAGLYTYLLHGWESKEKTLLHAYTLTYTQIQRWVECKNVFVSLYVIKHLPP